LPLEPVSDELGQSSQRHEAALADRLGIDQLAVMKPRLRIEHQAENEKDLAAVDERVLFDRSRHGVAFGDSRCADQRSVADSFPCTIAV
jgi:hypothetical protein